jgi:transposase InsO family protein
VTRYIVKRRDAFGVEPICRALGVPVSTHYARRSRKPSARELADRELLAEIEAARSVRRKVYGARKTWKELRRRDIDVGRDRVARVMREHGLEGKLRGRTKRTTTPDEAAAERALSYTQMKAGHSQTSITERYIHAAQVQFAGAAARAEQRMFSATGR